ncbi:MAG TPA: glycosyltransferase family 39 protein [Methylomirabilota bacterium]|nr:glycosyltransferase family 39 protein [Methylomirabilota bacterium]
MSSNSTSVSPPGPRLAAAPPSSWLLPASIILLGIILFGLRLAAPPNLLDQDQERPASYVLDVVKNGHWVYQRDWTGDITSKPPLYTWLCALTALACGQVNLLALYLPGALAALGTALLVLQAGNRVFGPRAGLFAALATLLTTAGLKEFGLARTDGVFAFTVTAAALLAFRAWQRGGGWAWFWALAAAATLTKGPLGLLFAANGLLAAWWERKSPRPHPLRGSQLPGVGVFLLLAGGWFLLAYWQAGPPLIAKMLGRELLAHAVSDGRRHYPGMLFYQPPLYYLGRAAPWSLAAFYGLWRLCKYPAVEDLPRRFERFLFCWFVVGLVILSIAPHQRADLLWPLLPAGALIAGRELARLTQNLRWPVLGLALAVLALFAVAGFGFYYFGAHARHPLVQQTVALKEFAKQIGPRSTEAYPLTHVDDPMTTQIYLNTLRPPVSFERAVELLRGPAAAFVVVSNLTKLESFRLRSDPTVYELLPLGVGQRRPAHLVSNRPSLELPDSFAFCVGPLLIEGEGVEILKATQHEIVVEARNDRGTVKIVNQSAEDRTVRLVSVYRGNRASKKRTLTAGEAWSLKEW